MGLNTLPDHVTAIKQLGARYRWIDLDRVGIYGMSRGGFASAAGMLRYPDFYKVGVSMAGNPATIICWPIPTPCAGCGTTSSAISCARSRRQRLHWTTSRTSRQSCDDRERP